MCDNNITFIEVDQNCSSMGNYSNDAMSSDVLNKVKTVPTYYLSSQVVSTVFFVFIFLLGVFGNLLVILVVCLNRNMKTSVNVFLINLCVADILVLTVCMPTVLVDVYAQDVWYFGETMCSLVPFVENTVVHVSVLTLIAISAERYRVVCRPLRGIRDTIKKSAKIVLLIWVICGISNIPWFFIARFRDSRQKDGTQIKVCRLPMVPQWHVTYVTLLCVLYFVVPFIILTVLYSRVCYILYRTKDDKTFTNLKDSQQNRHRHRLRVQVINIIFCLVLLFFIFHMPYRVISMWFTFANKNEIRSLGIHKYFNIVYSARILFYSNHAVNPIIYNFVSTKFRNGLRFVLTRRKREGSLTSSNRRGNYNTPFTNKRQSQVVLVERDCDNGQVNHLRNSSRSSSSRNNINEFFPMYANIIELHANGKYSSDRKDTSHDRFQV